MNERHPFHGPESGSTGVAVLGSTGSVGRQTLDVISRMPDRFHVVALAARVWSPLLAEQVARFRPELVSVAEPIVTEDLPPLAGAVLLTGQDGIISVATYPGATIVVASTSGHAGISATIAAIQQGKIIALANKETIVCAGEIIMPMAREFAAQIRTVDSEHSALWQSMNGARLDTIERLILTASGGPFRTTDVGELAKVTAAQALAHPVWTMGGKITIDSATLMNKGLEIIEAHWLFDVAYDRIDVLIHPESIIHSLVEFIDGSQIAQLGLPDMRLPIQYALTYPERLPGSGERLSLASRGSLTFASPDENKFPALRVAREAGVAGGTYPAVLSAADEVAVAAFLEGEITFPEIVTTVERVLDAHQPAGPLSLESISAASDWAIENTKWVLQNRR